MKCFMIETSVGFYQRNFLVKAMYFIKGIVFLMNKQRGEMVVNGDRKVRCLRGFIFLINLNQVKKVNFDYRQRVRFVNGVSLFCNFYQNP